MKDYSKGKIYKITSENYDKIYIGSTCRTLKKRINKHKYDMRQYIKQNPSSYYCSSYELCEEHDYKIELIKNYPCNSEQELRREEGRWQLLNKDIIVNKYIAGRTKKEYDNTEKRKASKKKHNQSEKGKASKSKWKKKRIKCSVCNKEISQGYLREHIKKQHIINN